MKTISRALVGALTAPVIADAARVRAINSVGLAFANTPTTAGVKPSGTQPNEGSILRSDGFVVTVPYDAPYAQIIDPANPTTPTNGAAHGGPAAAYRGAIYISDTLAICIPFKSLTVGLLNPTTGAITAGPAHGLTLTTGRGAFAGAWIGHDDAVYMVPCAGTQVARFDPVTLALTYMSATVPISTAGDIPPFSSAILMPPGDEAWFVPCGDLYPVRFNTRTGVATRGVAHGQSINTSEYRRGAFEFGCWDFRTGQAIMVRGDSNLLFKVKDATGALSGGIFPPSWAAPSNKTWAGIGTAADGRLVLYPRRSQWPGLVKVAGQNSPDFTFDNTLGLAFWTQGAQMLQATSSGNEWYFGGQTLLDGRHMVFARLAANHAIYQPFGNALPIPFALLNSRYIENRV